MIQVFGEEGPTVRSATVDEACPNTSVSGSKEGYRSSKRVVVAVRERKAAALTDRQAVVKRESPREGGGGRFRQFQRRAGNEAETKH